MRILLIKNIKYKTPTVITATEPVCERKASLAQPINIGKTVPPIRPIIIKPETSFFLAGILSKAWEKIIGKIFEFPSPIKAIQA